MTTSIRRFFKDDSGATSIEYGLIAGLIFLVIVGAVSLFATNVTLTFDHISNAVSEAVGS